MLQPQSICILWLLLLLHAGGCNGAMQFMNFKGRSDAREGDLRLVGSQKPHEGRVEIYHDGQWGTVCDDGWDIAEAQVVCRQLRFPGAKSMVTGAVYGEASGPIWMDDMECKGTEKYLNTCTFKGWGLTDCSHKEDVGVICDAGAEANMLFSSYVLDHSIVLSDDLGELFDGGTACDISVIAQSSTTNEQNGTLQTSDTTTICAHKLMLSHVPAFNITTETRNLTVDVTQSCLPYFSSFIRYLYSRRIDVTFSSVQCLHWLSSKFEIHQLMRDTGLLLTQFLPVDDTFETQISIHEYAINRKDYVLQENCVQYLAWNFQNFTQTPAWTQISEDLLEALLVRSDLVVPNEWFVLKAVENWILNNVNISLDTQAKLISQVRFPMIPAEELTMMQVLTNSSLYSTHKNVFNDNMLKALQFNIQLLTHIRLRRKLLIDDLGCQPRIYTSALWSVSFGPLRQIPFYQTHRQPEVRYRTISVPYHSSEMFHDRKTSWTADVFLNQYECSNRGMRCQSLPMARLISHEASYQPGIVFKNRLLLMCQGKYICQIQDFKNNFAFISKNATQPLTYPCPDDQYKFIFVVRPEYIG